MPIIKFVTWIAEKILDEAERDLYDPEKIQADLVNLANQLESGEITEEEYNQEETLLIDRLEVSQEISE